MERRRDIIIMGVSGAGKSTAGSLRLRLYDVETGRITIDGHDIRDLTQDRLRQAVAMVTQETAIFNRSALDNVLSPSLQSQWRDLWNLDAALPSGCDDCSLPNGDGLENVTPFYAENNPDRSFGLLSYNRDFVIRTFFGFPGATAFEDGLYDVRSSLPPSNSGTFFPTGEGHTFLLSPEFYSVRVNGTTAADWTTSFVAGAPTDLPASRPAVSVPLAAAD